MTKKQKVKAYRKAAEYTRLRLAFLFDTSLEMSGLDTEDYWISVMIEEEIFSNSTILLTFSERETILLSCAELVRLEFEIE